MYRIVRHMQEERLGSIQCLINFGFRLKGEGLGEKNILTMVFFQMRHGPGMQVFATHTKTSRSIVGTGSTKTGTRHIDIKTQVQGVLPFPIFRGKVSFTDMDRLVASLSE